MTFFFFCFSSVYYEPIAASKPLTARKPTFIKALKLKNLLIKSWLVWLSHVICRMSTDFHRMWLFQTDIFSWFFFFFLLVFQVTLKRKRRFYRLFMNFNNLLLSSSHVDTYHVVSVYACRNLSVLLYCITTNNCTCCT